MQKDYRKMATELFKAAERLRENTQRLLDTIREPREVPVGFDMPPEFATAEDAALAEAIFYVREAVAEYDAAKNGDKDSG